MYVLCGYWYKLKRGENGKFKILTTEYSFAKTVQIKNLFEVFTNFEIFFPDSKTVQPKILTF